MRKIIYVMVWQEIDVKPEIENVLNKLDGIIVVLL